MTDRFVPDGAETIAEDRRRRLTLSVAAEPHAAASALLGRTVFGDTGVRYRRRDAGAALAGLSPALHVSLTDADAELVGIYTLAASELRLFDEPLQGFYRGFLAVDAQSQAGGFGRFIVEQTLAWLHARARDAGVPVLTYGSIEQRNRRSGALLRSIGAERVGGLDSLFVYRQWPAKDIAVEQRTPVASDLALYARCYGDCGLVRAIDPDRTLSTTGDGAAAAVSLTRLRLERRPGIGDALTRWLFRVAPPARKRFDPDDFRYLTLAQPVLDDGADFGPFVSTLLARDRVHMAMLMLDPGSAMAQSLWQSGVLGRTARWLRESFDVLATVSHPERHDLGRAAAHPIALPPL